MGGSRFSRLCASFVVVLAVLTVGVSGAGAAIQHGIGFTKGCDSPTKVGDPYTCSFTIRNNVDDALDTLTINQMGEFNAASRRVHRLFLSQDEPFWDEVWIEH